MAVTHVSSRQGIRDVGCLLLQQILSCPNLCERIIETKKPLVVELVTQIIYYSCCLCLEMFKARLNVEHRVEISDMGE